MSVFDSISSAFGALGATPLDALTFASDAIGGIYTNQQNEEQAKKTRDWQWAMSSTAHQREVADLRAAGLNPILSANGGASTPTGATAINSNPFNEATRKLDSTKHKALQLLEEQTTATARQGFAAMQQGSLAATQATSTAEDISRKQMENELLDLEVDFAIQNPKTYLLLRNASSASDLIGMAATAGKLGKLVGQGKGAFRPGADKGAAAGKAVRERVSKYARHKNPGLDYNTGEILNMR